VTGSIVADQDNVKVTVEWPGGALTVMQYVEATEAIEKLWRTIQGRSASRVLMAASVTYDAGEVDDRT
jgi:hypothetical protein